MVEKLKGFDKFVGAEKEAFLAPENQEAANWVEMQPVDRASVVNEGLPPNQYAHLFTKEAIQGTAPPNSPMAPQWLGNPAPAFQMEQPLDRTQEARFRVPLPYDPTKTPEEQERFYTPGVAQQVNEAAGYSEPAQAEQVAPSRRSNVGGGSGAGSVSKSTIKAPDPSRLLASMDAQNAAAGQLRDQLAGIHADQEAQQAKQAEFYQGLADGYALEQEEANRDYEQRKFAADNAMNQFREMRAKGPDRMGIFERAGGLGSAIAAASVAFHERDSDKADKFFINLVDKDLKQQEALVGKAGQEAKELMGEMEKALGSKEAARDQFRVMRLAQMEEEAGALAAKAQNATTRHNLQQMQLKLAEKKEQLSYKIQQSAYNAMIAQRAAAAKRRASTKKEKSSQQVAEAEIVRNKARVLEQKLESFNKTFGADNYVIRQVPGVGQVLNFIGDIANSDEAAARQEIQRIADDLTYAQGKMVFGAMSEGERGLAEKIGPKYGASRPEQVISAARQIQRDATSRIHSMTGTEEEEAERIRTSQGVKNYGTPLGK